ncbi:thiamine precursor transporter HmpT [Clostridiales bacterium]|nr:ECF transporter S component [Clostridiales bacterium]GFI56136.1 thiamine precursor transporter HmpT [Clostridiales bacterium]
MNKHIRRLVGTALFAAAILVGTMVLGVPLPSGGYGNFGDVFVITAAFFLGPVWGFAAAGLGSALADILLGFALYAPATFIIKGCMAVLFACLCRSVRPRAWFAMSAFLAEAVMVGGYFLFESFLYGPGAALANVPGNMAQGVLGLVLSSVIVITASASKPIMRYAAAWKKG